MRSQTSRFDRPLVLALVLALMASIAFIGTESTPWPASADEGDGLGPEVLIGPVVMYRLPDAPPHPLGDGGPTHHVGDVYGQDLGDSVVRFTYRHTRPVEPVAPSCGNPANQYPYVFGVGLVRVEPPRSAADPSQVWDGFVGFVDSDWSEGLYPDAPESNHGFFRGYDGPDRSFVIDGTRTTDDQFQPGDWFSVDMQVTEGKALADFLAETHHVPRDGSLAGPDYLDETMFSLNGASPEGRMDFNLAGWYDECDDWGYRRFTWFRGGLLAEAGELSPEFAAHPGAPGEFTFVPTDTTSDRVWAFGDGETSTLVSPTHTYDLPGTYTVSHCLVNGEPVCHILELEVEAPTLTGEIVFIREDDEPEKFKVNEEFQIQIELAASDGVGDLDVWFNREDMAAWLDDIDQLDVDADTLPEIPDPFTLEPGSELSFTWNVKAVSGGSFELEAVLVGTDAAGTEIGPVELVATGEIGGLEIQVTVHYPEPVEGADPPAHHGFQQDNNGDGVIDEKDHRIEIEVSATNNTGEILNGVGPLGGTGHVVSFSNKLLGDGQVRMRLLEDDPDLDPELQSTSFGNMEPGEKVTRRYAFEATGVVYAEVRAFLEGVPASGGVVRELGTADVRMVSDLAVEFKITTEDRPYTSGDTVRLFGSVKNLLEDEVDENGEVEEEAPYIAVLVTPLFSLWADNNAANGVVRTEGSSSGTPGMPTPIVVAPGEEVDISAILVTMRTEEPSHARVWYTVQAWQLDIEDDVAAAAVEIDRSRIVIVEDDTYAEEHSVSLAAFDFTPDDLRECIADVLDARVSCFMWAGLRDSLLGLWSLKDIIPFGIAQAGSATYHTGAWILKMQIARVKDILGDPEAQQYMFDEWAVLVDTFNNLGIQMAEGTDEHVVGFFEEAEQVITSGDHERMIEFFSYQTGANFDLVAGGFAKLFVLNAIQRSHLDDVAARSAAANRVRQAAEEAADAAQSGVTQRVQDSINRGENPATNGTFRGGEDVTNLAMVTRRVYGSDLATSKALLAVARAENVIIAIRSRAPQVANFVEAGLIWLKSQDVKAKTVNVIDVHYLGGRYDSIGLVEVTTPPVDWRLTGQALENAIDAHMSTLRSRHPEIAADAVWEGMVRARLKQRTEEFPKMIKEFARYRNEGIKLEFGYDQQGLLGRHARETVEIREALVRTVRDVGFDGVERWYFTLEMRGPASNPQFRRIGADTDVVLILNPDGTPILDPLKRRRIYEHMQETDISMLHGETGSFTNPEVQAKLLRNHVADTPGAEALLVHSPDERIRTGYLQEVVSTKLGPDGEPVGSLFHLVSGAAAELKSGAAVAQGFQLQRFIHRLDNYIHTLAFYLPGRLAQLAASLSEEDVSDTFTGDGLLIQPDGSGGLRIYLPDDEFIQLGATGTTTSGFTSMTVAGSLDTGLINPSVAGNDVTILNIDDITDPDLVLDHLLVQAEAEGLLPEGPPDVGAAGGRWQPITVTEALQAGGGTINLAPMTTLAADAEAGDTRIAIHSAEDMGMTSGSDWFQPGDTIVIDPGGSKEEFATVIGLGSLQLGTPLTNTHDHGTPILLIATTTKTNDQPPQPDEEEDEEDKGPDPGPGTDTDTILPGPSDTDAPAPGAPGSDGTQVGGDLDDRTATGPLPATGGSHRAAMLWAVLLLLVGSTLVNATRGNRTRTLIRD